MVGRFHVVGTLGRVGYVGMVWVVELDLSEAALDILA